MYQPAHGRFAVERPGRAARGARVDLTGDARDARARRLRGLDPADALRPDGRRARRPGRTPRPAQPPMEVRRSGNGGKGGGRGDRVLHRRRRLLQPRVVRGEAANRPRGADLELHHGRRSGIAHRPRRSGLARGHVRGLVERHEGGREEPWSVDDAPPAYIEGQAKGIVGLELRIAGIEGKRKLSQNRSAEDIAGVIEGLTAGTPREHAVAADMRMDISQE